jgi:hypothetical protein
MCAARPTLDGHWAWLRHPGSVVRERPSWLRGARFGNGSVTGSHDPLLNERVREEALSSQPHQSHNSRNLLHVIGFRCMLRRDVSTWPRRGGHVDGRKGLIMEVLLVVIATIVGFGLLLRWTRTRTAH